MEFISTEVLELIRFRYTVWKGVEDNSTQADLPNKNIRLNFSFEVEFNRRRLTSGCPPQAEVFATLLQYSTNWSGKKYTSPSKLAETLLYYVALHCIIL